MDGFVAKLEQKALKQAKQKKSKSAEFLMAEEDQEEERGVVKGTLNPGFLSGREEDEPGCGVPKDLGREIGGDKQNSTLTVHQQQTELEALASTRGIECERNYFDPWATAESDPRRHRAARVGAGDELELRFMCDDEQSLYEKLSEMLNEDDASAVINLPGSVLEERIVAGALKLPLAEWRYRFREKLEKKREVVIPHYAEQLREQVQDDMIPIGRPSLEQNEGATEKMEWARKQKMMAILRGSGKEFCSIRDMGQEEAVLLDRLYAAFQQAESRLLNSLRQHQAKVNIQYGELTEVTEPLEIGSDLPWQVEWARAPQPVEVCVLCLRAVREKLCRGLYKVCVSLHSRLGGPALCWSHLKEQRWMGVTELVEHQGQFCDTELYINQRIHMVLPASCDLLPSAVLVFKLLRMLNKESAMSTVVAWGVFPVCDNTLTLTQGRFRTPLLRGRPHPDLDQFRKIEQLLSDDLDTWLCNLYFQVRKLPQRPVFSEDNVNEGTHEDSPDVIASACCSTTLPGNSHEMFNISEPSSVKAKPLTNTKGGKQKQPIRTNSNDCLTERELHTSVITEQLQHFCFATQFQHGAPRYPVQCDSVEQLRLLWHLLPAELGLPRSPVSNFSHLAVLFIVTILTWFLRLYMHYCGQWFYLHARDIPINRFRFHAHTVDLVYQSSLLTTLEELLLVLLGPLTLNATMFLLLLIRWLCQLLLGSTPSLLSKTIMTVGVWTVLDPLAIFTVDAFLGRLSYSAEEPVADAAKLYWHFHYTEQSGTSGIIITLFLYTVLFMLSFTMLYIYFLRLHNDGRMLDVYHRLHSSEGTFFIPDDLEMSNQELSYIVKKAEQWRGFNGERRKVAVYEYVWTQEESGGGESLGAVPNSPRETSTHVYIYTLYPSGLRHPYRHFLRQPSGTILELTGDLDNVEAHLSVQGQKTVQDKEEEKMKSPTHTLRERKNKKSSLRPNRVGPVGESDCKPCGMLNDYSY